MDAKISQVNLKPAKYDKEGQLVDDQYASVTLNVPMDSESQRRAVKDIHDLLSKEWVKFVITTDQGELEFPTRGEAQEQTV